MQRKHKLIALFPYLFVDTREGIRVDGMTLKSSFPEVLTSEDSSVRGLLDKMIRCFRNHSNEHVGYWSYVIEEIASREEWNSTTERLKRLCDALRFTRLSRMSPNAHFSNFSFWLFEIPPEFDSEEEVVFFDPLLNGISSSGFYLQKGEPVNPYRPSRDLLPVVLTREEVVNDRYLKALYFEQLFLSGQSRQRSKLFRAIEWFNRSFSHSDRGVDLSEAILNMHTALEALLRPESEQRGVRTEIRKALLTLLGHRPEIAKWFNSFHTLRNSVVHGDVEPSSFTYIHPDSPSKVGNHHHLPLAREVFIASIDAIIQSTAHFPLLGFEEKLVANARRVENAITAFTSRRHQNWRGVVKDAPIYEIHKLRTDDITSSKERAAELGKLLLPYIRQELEEHNTSGSYKCHSQPNRCCAELVGW
jgi:hypothetical protein